MSNERFMRHHYGASGHVEPEHRPAWRVENDKPEGMYNTHHVYEGDRYICATSPENARRIVDAMNGSRLFAAAPELLEAVKDALAFLDRPDITTYEWYKLAPDHVRKFRQAIAKAEAE